MTNTALEQKDMTTAIKLNTTQEQVLRAVHFQGDISQVTVHPSTRKFLDKNGLLNEDGTLSEAGFIAIGEPVVDRAANARIQEIEELLKPVGFEELSEKMTGVEDDDAASELQPWTFDKDWALWERRIMGFEATIGWNNIDVWHGLTAEEIREDMDTATPMNRASKRAHFRMLRNASRRLQGKQGRNRKAIKICGGKG